MEMFQPVIVQISLLLRLGALEVAGHVRASCFTRIRQEVALVVSLTVIVPFQSIA